MTVLDSSGNNGSITGWAMYFVYFLNLGEKIGNTLLFRTAYSDECWLIHRSHFLFVGLMFYHHLFFYNTLQKEPPLINSI